MFNILKKIFANSNKSKAHQDRIFDIDYLNIDYDTTLKNCKVQFIDGDYSTIIVNGESMRFYPCEYREVGWSSDNLYRKIYTSDFAFWIKPQDYDDILKIIKNMDCNYKDYAKKEKQRDKQLLKSRYSKEFNYDEITEDIYKCCISDKNGQYYNINCGGDFKKFMEIEDKISEICKDHGGRYYKTKCKSVKYIIVFGCNARTSENIESYRAEGYKVVSFQEAIKYFGLSDYWDIGKMDEEIMRIKNHMVNKY